MGGRLRPTFQTIILTLCLSILACTLAVSFILLSRVYAIAGNMQQSISTYQTINQLSRNISEAGETYQQFFTGLTGAETLEEISHGGGNIRDALYRAKAEANNLAVTYQENQDRYFLVRAIQNGLDYLTTYSKRQKYILFQLKFSRATIVVE